MIRKIDKIVEKFQSATKDGREPSLSGIEEVFSTHRVMYLYPLFLKSLKRANQRINDTESLCNYSKNIKCGDSVASKVWGLSSGSIRRDRFKKNEKLIGGCEVFYGGYRYDASVLGQVKRLQEYLER